MPTGRARFPFALLSVSFFFAVACGRDAAEHAPQANAPAKPAAIAPAAPADERVGPNAGGSLPKLAVRMDDEAWAKLGARLAKARASGKLPHDDEEEADVRVQVELDGQTLKGRARLKGDKQDHLNPEHPSLRIKLSAVDRLFGQRTFSLQHPSTRNYQAEPLYFGQARDLGVLTPRYRFVEVRVHDRAPIVMAMEEHFSKELLESQQRRESVIVRFDETLLWASDLNHDQLYFHAEPFRANYTARIPNLAHERDLAVGLLRSFVEGKMPASQVFDVKTLTTFLAVTELWDAGHALLWNNLRFYYNPLLGKLEPVAYDGNDPAVHPYDYLLNVADETSCNQLMQQRWLADAQVRDGFFERLHEVARSVTEGSMLATLQQREAALLAELPANAFGEHRIDWDAFRRRAASLLEANASNYQTLTRSVDPKLVRAPALPLQPSESPHLTQYVRTYLVHDGKETRLELFNLLSRPVKIESVEGAKLAAGVTLPVTLAGAAYAAPRGLPLALAKSPAGDVHVRVSVPDHFAALDHLALAYPAVRSTPVLPETTVEDVARVAPAARIDTSAHTVTFPAGTHRVRESLVLPPGYSLVAGPGVQLRFAANTVLMVRGGCAIDGSEAAPVVFEPEARDWAGFVVLAGGAHCSLTHLVVRKTHGVALGEWGSTGGTTIYDANLQLAHSRFEGSGAEDTINMIRSGITLQDVQLSDTHSDAIDCDFSHGTAQDVRMRHVGADGLDTSGCKLDVRDLSVDGGGDKAVSCGEKSTLLITNLRATGTKWGAAAKDGSTCTLRGVELSRVRAAALLAFRKKPEYPPATLDARDVKLDHVSERYWLQEGHTLLLEGQALPPTKFDLAAIYGEAYVKSGIEQVPSVTQRRAERAHRPL